jgi:hypothetical protein
MLNVCKENLSYKFDFILRSKPLKIQVSYDYYNKFCECSIKTLFSIRYDTDT